MRPASINWFERLYLGSLAVTLAMVAMVWEPIRTGVISPARLLLALTFSILLPFVLILLVSRGRSVVAKWVLVALFAIGLIGTWANYRPGGDLILSLIAVAVSAMQIVAVGLLFTAPARAWLGKREIPQARLRSTFD